MGDKIRVLLTDDHAVLRQGLKLFLDMQPDIEVVGEADDGAVAVEQASLLNPDVIVMDLEMPNMTGIEATQAIKSRTPDAKILVLTSTMEDDILFPALRAGASGYQLKSAQPSELAESIRTVHRGEPLLHPNVMRRLMSQLSMSGRDLEGTITILFTDIEGSTAMVAELGDEAARAIFRQHDALVRDIVKNHGGVEVKHQGDGFMMAFSSARRAVQCAVEVQQAIAEHNRERPRAAFRVRMGLNTGEAIAENKDFFGHAVIVAARIAAKAEGAQIFVSELTRGLLSASSIRFVLRGTHRLKGLKGTFKIYEVDWQKGVNPRR